MFYPIVGLTWHFSWHFSIRSDEGLALETSAFESLYGINPVNKTKLSYEKCHLVKGIDILYWKINFQPYGVEKLFFAMTACYRKTNSELQGVRT